VDIKNHFFLGETVGDLARLQKVELYAPWKAYHKSLQREAEKIRQANIRVVNLFALAKDVSAAERKGAEIAAENLKKLAEISSQLGCIEELIQGIQVDGIWHPSAEHDATRKRELEVNKKDREARRQIVTIAAGGVR
jgi:hypothetical protein